MINLSIYKIENETILTNSYNNDDWIQIEMEIIDLRSIIENLWKPIDIEIDKIYLKFMFWPNPDDMNTIN